MRRNSSLYERMCRGHVDAWADPGAILEMMIHPGDSGIGVGASKCAAFSADVGQWEPGSIENVSMVLSGYWDRLPAIEKMKLMTSVSTRDVDVAARVVDSVMRCVDLDSVERKGFDPLTDEGRSVFSYLKKFPSSKRSKNWNTGMFHQHDFGASKLASSMESLVKISGASISDEYDRVYRAAHEDPTVNAVVSMDNFIETVTGERGVCKMSFLHEFPEPVIWAPDHMVKNGMRRR